MDFGIARLKTSDLKTQLGVRLGTPKYMSPEQSSGATIDHRTDIFSLGIVLYEMLTGARLFQGDSLPQVLHNVATFVPPPPSRLKPEVSSLLDLVVMRALAKKPEDRYGNAWEMVDDLHNCLQELVPSVPASRGSAETAAKKVMAAEDAPDRTVVLKPQFDSTVTVRRVSADADTSKHMSLSRRFDSAAALKRLQSPDPRDLERLARTHNAPGLLRRLLFDRGFALFAFSLVWSVVVAGVVALS
jgi:serine/threonine-protein kinase